MDPERLRQTRSAPLTGHLPEDITTREIEKYSKDVVRDFESLCRICGAEDARCGLRQQLLALKRAEEAILVDRARALIRTAEDEGLI